MMGRWSLASVLIALAAVPIASAQQDVDDIKFGPRHAVPRASCQLSDRPETDLQGRVPPSDIQSGRAAQGYNCNLALVGHFPTTVYSTLDTFGDCAYFERAPGTGVQVLDVSDSSNPAPTAVLVTPAMLNPWESLRVNAKRKLLVADTPTSNFLDIYDLSNCAMPMLVSSTNMSPAAGHEGWFSPDGMTYFMASAAVAPNSPPGVYPVDIGDPAQPKLLPPMAVEARSAAGGPHGGATTEDGTRTYVCEQASPPDDRLLIMDSSEITARRADAKWKLLAEIPLGDNQWCQGAFRVTYRGHPYLIQYGERSGAPDCSRSAANWATFAYPRIYDLADDRRPVLVSTALLEVHLPEHCEEVTGEGVAVSEFGYSVHHCTSDRLYDPTILACSWFGAGLRVLDIRDPYRPRELAYFNPGAPADNAFIGTASRPVIRADRGEIWFTNSTGGFYVVRFENGIWPFPGSARCPEFDDYYFAHYNPLSRCATANFNGLGRPLPTPPQPPPAEKAAARLVLKVKVIRRRAPRRIRVTGRVVTSRDAGSACRGSVSVRALVARRTVSKRALRLSTTCSFRTTVSLPRRVRSRRATIVVRFAGNDQVRATTARRVMRLR